MGKNSLYGNKYVNIIEDKLKIDKFDVLELADQFSTPTFVFLLDKISANIQKIQQCFSEVFPKSRGFYSIKANFLEPIVNIVKENNFGAEIVGLPELNLLKKINFPFSDVIGGGPYLPNEFLDAMIHEKIGY